MIRIATLIDGGNLRALTRQGGRHHDPAHIEKVAHPLLNSPFMKARSIPFVFLPVPAQATRALMASIVAEG